MIADADLRPAAQAQISTGTQELPAHSINPSMRILPPKAINSF
jgi:hypothetical protein